MAPLPSPSSDTVARARAMYLDGAPVRAICAATGLSVGTLYYHLDGRSLPGLVPPRLPRRRIVEGEAATLPASRGRRRLAARLWRAAERQARKIEYALSWGPQSAEQRTHDLAALREIAKILRELTALENASAPAPHRRRGPDAPAPVEHETALAVEGRAVYVQRVKRG
jgi:AcrR family transcriptional regulator